MKPIAFILCTSVLLLACGDQATVFGPEGQGGSPDEPMPIGGDNTGSMAGGGKLEGGAGPGGAPPICFPGQAMVLADDMPLSPLAVAAGDIDGDGDDDLALARDGQTLIARNDGGSLALDGQGLGDSWTLGVLLADLDADGDLDLLEANYVNQPNTLWLNDGTGSFTTAGSVGSGSTYDVVAADLDDDGWLDVVTVNEATQGIRLHLGDDFGGYPGYEQEIVLASPQAGTFHTAVAADFDGDGRMDLAASGADVPIRIWFNDGDGAPTSGPVLTYNARALAAADIDGDGLADLVAGSDDEGQPSPILINQGGGSFVMSIGLGIGGVRSLSIGDVDSDGDQDVLAGSSTYDTLWLNNGAGAFTQRVEPDLSGHDTRSLTFLNLDGDCDLDVAAATGAALALWSNE